MSTSQPTADARGPETPTLEMFAPDCEFPEADDDTPRRRSRTHSGETLDLSLGESTRDTPATETLERAYRNGLLPHVIAALHPFEPTQTLVEDRLRSAGVLKGWDDSRVLDMLYNEYGLSTTAIAEYVFGGQITSETVRVRLHAFDIADREPTSSELLEAMDPEDLDLSPSETECDPNYTRRRKVRA